jgi:DNA-binding LytR/AlgR family response regulator
MNVVIIEDENLAAERLEEMIRSYDATIRVLARIESVKEAVQWLTSNPAPDLIFLDIQLEDDLSFSIFDKTEVLAPVIFTTAFDEFAIKAFKLNSIDYLLKPISKEDLKRAIDKFKSWTRGTSNMEIKALMKELFQSKPEYKNRIIVNTGSRIKSISMDEVAYFYSELGMTFVVTANKSEYPIDLSLDKLLLQLNPLEFFRINRQFLIQIHSIRNIHVFPKSRLKLELYPPHPKEVFVSLDRVTDFKEWLDR